MDPVDHSGIKGNGNDFRNIKALKQARERLVPQRRELLGRTESAGKKCKTMIVALARKLLIALWRLVTTGEVPAGVVLRAA
jgi:hypothetical protein